MADLIDRAALLADIDETFVFSGRVGSEFAQIRGANKIVDRIKAAPAVDAVEVVRCKDCKNRYYNEFQGEFCCEAWADGYDTIVRDNDYCSYGERRTDG